MNVLTAMTNTLLIITLSGCIAARAEEAAGGNNEPATEQTDSTKPKTDPQTETQTEPKTETKPASGAAEPGCSD